MRSPSSARAGAPDTRVLAEAVRSVVTALAHLSPADRAVVLGVALEELLGSGAAARTLEAIAADAAELRRGR